MPPRPCSRQHNAVLFQHSFLDLFLHVSRFPRPLVYPNRVARVPLPSVQVVLLPFIAIGERVAKGVAQGNGAVEPVGADIAKIFIVAKKNPLTLENVPSRLDGNQTGPFVDAAGPAFLATAGDRPPLGRIYPLHDLRPIAKGRFGVVRANPALSQITDYGGLCQSFSKKEVALNYVFPELHVVMDDEEILLVGLLESPLVADIFSLIEEAAVGIQVQHAELQESAELQALRPVTLHESRPPFGSVAVDANPDFPRIEIARDRIAPVFSHHVSRGAVIVDEYRIYQVFALLLQGHQGVEERFRLHIGLHCNVNFHDQPSSPFRLCHLPPGLLPLPDGRLEVTLWLEFRIEIVQPSSRVAPIESFQEQRPAGLTQPIPGAGVAKQLYRLLRHFLPFV